MAIVSDRDSYRQHQQQHRERATSTSTSNPTGRISASGLPPPTNDTTTTNAPPPFTTFFPSSTPRTVGTRTLPSAPFSDPPLLPICGHERGFVQPSSYLRSRPPSHPMPPSQPDRAIDREERQGLVSLFFTISLLTSLLARPGLFDFLRLGLFRFFPMSRIRQNSFPWLRRVDISIDNHCVPAFAIAYYFPMMIRILPG